MSTDEGLVTSMERLLAPQDAEFIRVAYEAVLGRAPDPAGGAYFIGRLRAGAHKLEILKQLRRSPEGSAFIPGVAGLDRAIRRHDWENLPLIGTIIRLFTGGEGNSATERQLRVISNEIARLRNEQAAIANLMAGLGSQHDPGMGPVLTSFTAGTGSGVGIEPLPKLEISMNPRPGLAGFFQTSVWGR